MSSQGDLTHANGNAQQNDKKGQTSDNIEASSTPNIVQERANKEDGMNAVSSDTSIQSPASTLADTLSHLSLSTPAAVEFKASELGRNGEHSEKEERQAASLSATNQFKEELHLSAADQDDASDIALRKPVKPQEGDISVGLVYDAIMEEHRGPPGTTSSSEAAYHLQLTAQSKSHQQH